MPSSMYVDTPGWIDRMRSTGVLAVAKALGIAVQPARGSNGGAFTCPACNASRRHTKTRDRRGAAGVRRDGSGWRCFQCDTSGDSIDLVSFALQGGPLAKLSPTGKTAIRDWCRQWLGLDGSEFSAPATRVQPTAPPPPPSYPPREETLALWVRAGRVDADPETAAWLRDGRGLEPEAIAELDLARAIPRNDSTLPRWAGFGGDDDKPWRSWPSVGLRLAVPMFDATGNMRSMLFRRCFESDRTWPPKSMAANGFGRAGLVLANAAACRLLAYPIARATDVSVVIEEGETDWLTGCLAWAGNNERAIFGVTSGSWSEELAARLPHGARVTIRTDNDDAGERLAQKIAKTLQGRCTVLRGGRKTATSAV